MSILGVKMSLTETLMLVALGFALALIIVLLVGRGLWSMAMRLGARRQAKQVPAVMIELQADRDRLRAEHAMMARKLELRLADIKGRMTEQMAEVSRHRNRIHSMTADLDRRDDMLKMREQEIGALNAQLDVHKFDLGSASDLIDKLSADLLDKQEAISQHETYAKNLSYELNLRSQMAGEANLPLREADGKQASLGKIENGENRLMQRVAELTSISSQIMTQRESNPMMPVLALRMPEGPTTHLDEESTVQPVPTNPEAETEKQASELTEHLKTLDLALEPSPSGDDDQKKSGAMANVISLAQRIRALQKNSD